MDEWFPQALKLTTRIIEVGGIAIIVLGTLGATITVLWQILKGRSGVGENGRRNQVVRV